MSVQWCTKHHRVPVLIIGEVAVTFQEVVQHGAQEADVGSARAPRSSYTEWIIQQAQQLEPPRSGHQLPPRERYTRRRCWPGSLVVVRPVWHVAVEDKIVVRSKWCVAHRVPKTQTARHTPPHGHHRVPMPRSWVKGGWWSTTPMPWGMWRTSGAQTARSSGWSSGWTKRVLAEKLIQDFEYPIFCIGQRMCLGKEMTYIHGFGFTALEKLMQRVALAIILPSITIQWLWLVFIFLTSVARTNVLFHVWFAESIPSSS